jgi:hypothetical protein
MLINPNNYKVFFDYSLLHPNDDGRYFKKVGKECTQKEYDDFQELNNKHIADDNLYKDPCMGTGRYNTTNCDVYGLREFIKDLYEKCRPSIPISVELINLNKFNSITGFEKILEILKKK